MVLLNHPDSHRDLSSVAGCHLPGSGVGSSGTPTLDPSLYSFPSITATLRQLTFHRITTIFGVICITADQFILPLKPVHGSMKRKLAQIDYLGIVLSAGATVFLLVPISGGGTTFAWDSATVVALLVAGVVVGAAFIVSQWKFARLPILPCELPCTHLCTICEARLTSTRSTSVQESDRHRHHDSILPDRCCVLRSK
jgi:Na+(H+)/acetate symporter ActP